MIKLVDPDVKYKDQYLEMLDAWRVAGEPPVPWVLAEEYGDFKALVSRLMGYARAEGIPDNFVPSSTYWILEAVSGKIAGAVNIRHRLNEELLRLWGGIGYGIRPDMRQRGHASEALALALDLCRGMGMDKVLLSCHKENLASAKVIIRNGGELENEVIECERIVQRYWIYL